MKGILFDFNGTLFYDTEKHQAAWRRYGETLLGRPIGEEEFQSSMLGRNNPLILTYLLGRTTTEEEVSCMGGEKEACYRELCLKDPAHLHLAPGAEDFLDAMKAAGVKGTIATSSDRENVNFYFEQFGLERWFEFEKCVYEDGSFRGKPFPDIYLLAAERLSLAPGDCFVFEDALSGIQSGVAAGARGVVAVASSAPKERLADVEGVTCAIRDYRELKEDFFAL